MAYDQTLEPLANIAQDFTMWSLCICSLHSTYGWRPGKYGNMCGNSAPCCPRCFSCKVAGLWFDFHMAFWLLQVQSGDP